MIKFYLDEADATANNPSEFQSRWNCDGSYWLWTYEKDRPNDFSRLINRIKDGHISAPLNALVLCLGGAPAEAVLRGMYYPGRLERQHNIRFPIAISMENQTLPYGLISLWSGSGAQYSWKGICGCDTLVPAPWDREHEIYWALGPDGSRVLMKWYSNLNGYQGIGSYAEARNTADSVDFVDSNAEFKARHPFNIIGVFGKGWDDFKTLTREFVQVARTKTNANRKVIVSNQVDFFTDFNQSYGSEIASIGCSFGNEWDLYCAALAEVSAQVKRSVEKLRTAEAAASLATLTNANFMQSRQAARENAWMALGLFWEHNFGVVNPQIVNEDPVNKRIAWQRQLAADLKTYVDTLQSDALTALGQSIQKSGTNTRFFVFNALSWSRTGIVDYPYTPSGAVKVIDLVSNQEVPSQTVTVSNVSYLRILASSVPGMGYKVYEIQSGAGQTFSNPPTANAGTRVIENQVYKITLADRGAVTSLLDKTRSNREMVRVVNGRAMNDLGSGSGTVTVENAGPVTVTLKAVSSTPLPHTTRITLGRESRLIDIQNEITQNFNTTLTWGFGFELPNPDIWHEEVGAVLRAKKLSQGGHYSDRVENSRYDWLTLNHFADISSGNVGVTLSNADCYFMKVGNSDASTLDTATPHISVLAGGRVVSGGNGLPNQGNDSYFLQRFGLATHAAFNPVEAMKFALEHQNPLTASTVTGGSAYPATQYSFLSVDNPNVLVWALKPADDGPQAGLVVRVWNVSSSPAAFTLSVAAGPIISALQLTHIETPIAQAALTSGKLSDALSAQQMKTYAISTSQPLVNADQYPTAVPLDLEAVSTSQPVSAAATATLAVEQAPSGNGEIQVSPTAASIATNTPQAAVSSPVAPDTTPTNGRGCLLGFLG
jgi:alpha-mannosidase